MWGWMLGEVRRAMCNWNWVSLRNMGGGPRTFPGGVNKWKWKRMHEKLARDKQNRLIEQEKQLYQARIRSHIRYTLSPDHHSAAAAAKHTKGYRSVPKVGNGRVGAHKYRFWRKGSDDSSSSESESEVELSVKKRGSSASLGEYDVKRERRVVPKTSPEVEFIRYQLNKRKLSQIEDQQSQEQQQSNESCSGYILQGWNILS